MEVCYIVLFVPLQGSGLESSYENHILVCLGECGGRGLNSGAANEAPVNKAMFW